MNRMLGNRGLCSALGGLICIASLATLVAGPGGIDTSSVVDAADTPVRQTAPRPRNPVAPQPPERVPEIAATPQQRPADAPEAENERESTTPVDHSDISEGLLQKRLQRLQDNAELEDDVREELSDQYHKALEHLSTESEAKTSLEVLEARLQQAPTQTRETQARLDGTRPEPKSLIKPDASLDDLQAGLTAAESLQEEWDQKRDELQNQIDRRSSQRVELAQRETELQEELDEIDAQIGRDPDESESKEVVEAGELLLKARRQAVDAELHLIRKEIRSFEPLGDLLMLERDLAVVEAAYAEELVAAWTVAVNAERRGEIELQTREAARQLKRSSPRLVDLARRNLELTERRRAIVDRIEEAQQQAQQAEQQASELSEEFETVADRTRRAGFTEAVAVVLRRRRDNLPSVPALRDRARDREHETAQLSLQLAELEDERRALADLGAAATKRMKSLATSPGEGDSRARGTLNPDPVDPVELRRLLKSQRSYLDGLIGDTSGFLEALLELETAERQLMRQTQSYARFCDENVLWIRSTVPPQVADGARLVQAAGELLQPAIWWQTCRGLARDLRANPVRWVVAICAVAGTLLLARTRQRQLRQLVARTGSDDRTARLAVTAVWAGAIAIPLALWFVGWRLAQLHTDDLSGAVGRALQTVALLLGPLRVIRLGTRMHRIHSGVLRWNAVQVESCRRVARILSWCGIPLLWLTLIGTNLAGDVVRNALGRAAFLAFQLLLAWGVWRLGSQDAVGPPTAAGDRRHLSGNYWIVVSVMVPMAFALLSLWGYHYTAVQLELRVLGMLGLWGALRVIERLCSTWILSPFRSGLTRKSTGDAPALDASAEIAPMTPAEAAAGLESAGNQLRRLLQMSTMAVFVLGTWMIWSRVLPAFSVLQTVELWPHPFRILESTDLENRTGILTLAGLGLATLIGTLTWFLEHTLPELIDMTLLRRTRLDAGGRYAVAAVSRYCILVTGTLAAFSQLGIGWAQLNWLVAAMTVGLGFGLQEIFANFVSGLILLFERPVRIGDIVSIGDVTGTVSRIRMRATTITDGELRELLVPNKELITGRVINWTLTNTLSRLTVKVRVAVGTDPDFARGLLLAVAAKHPTVLKQPPPQAQFEDFADNSLNFSLRVCIASCDGAAQVRHELLTAIKREFQEAGISSPVGPPAAGKGAATPATAPPGYDDKSRLTEFLPKPHSPLRTPGGAGSVSPGQA